MREVRSVMFIAAVILAYFGFRFVTQAGQDFPIQNDGYAGTGGVMILLAGIMAGLLIERGGNGKK